MEIFAEEYFNYTAPSPKWLIGNVLKDNIEEIINKTINNDVEAIQIAKKTPLIQLAKKYGNSDSERVFSFEDYEMYLLNKRVLDSDNICVD